MHTLSKWFRLGGVIIIGYEMFRNMTLTKKPEAQESIKQCLLNPGPDVIICDEGHKLKNKSASLTKSVVKVRTKRRICLTGTPLQNNLKECKNARGNPVSPYSEIFLVPDYCMVQFVKPKLLGTEKSFIKKFVNPITGGEKKDSTEFDVKLMKRRAHVLHKVLEGHVQRFDHNILSSYLPPKEEYVILVSLSEKQIKLYKHYLQNFTT